MMWCVAAVNSTITAMNL